MDIVLLKITTIFTTLASMLVYNFRKHFKGIKTKYNISYSKGKGIWFKKLDVHYSKNFKEEEVKPCIIYFHGGGWATFSKCVYTTLTRRFAKMGYVVFNVNYVLAPKYKMEQVINSCFEAVKFVQSNATNFGGDPSKIVLAGDSAGAHISSLLTGWIKSKKVQDEELENSIKALVLLYGVYDLTTMQTTGFPRIKTYTKAVLKNKGISKEENDEYSPINYVGNNNYPPCFIASGEIDKLHKSQSEEFNNWLKEKNIKTKTLFYDKNEPRAFHAYMVFDDLITNEQTRNEISKFLEEVFK